MRTNRNTEHDLNPQELQILGLWDVGLRITIHEMLKEMKDRKMNTFLKKGLSKVTKKSDKESNRTYGSENRTICTHEVNTFIHTCI